MKAQFPKLAAKLARVGLAQERAPISQYVDVESGMAKVIIRELLQPVNDLWVQLNSTPCHRNFAIGGLRYRRESEHSVAERTCLRLTRLLWACLGATVREAHDSCVSQVPTRCNSQLAL